MRIVIFSDSLAMPRENVPIEQVWTSLFLRRFAQSNEIYIFSKRGATTSDLVSAKQDILHLYKPDMVIVQLGIVDCVRRALPVWVSRIAARIPILSGAVKLFASRYHYILTKIFNSYSVPLSQFELNVKTIMEECKKRQTKAVFISIAEPGNFLVSKTFNVNSDVSQYNSVMKSVVNTYDGIYVDPYNPKTQEGYVLEEDGHHLNKFGHERVFSSLMSIIEKLGKQHENG